MLKVKNYAGYYNYITNLQDTKGDHFLFILEQTRILDKHSRMILAPFLF